MYCYYNYEESDQLIIIFSFFLSLFVCFELKIHYLADIKKSIIKIKEKTIIISETEVKHVKQNKKLRWTG